MERFAEVGEKLVWFRMLKKSARYSSLSFSVMENDLPMVVSRLIS